MTNQTRAYIFAIITVLLWSTVATAFKFTLRYQDVFQLLFYACLTSALTLLIVIAIRGQLRKLIVIFKQHWKITVIAGGLNPCLYYLVLFEAYDRLPAQVAQPINYTQEVDYVKGLPSITINGADATTNVGSFAVNSLSSPGTPILIDGIDYDATAKASGSVDQVPCPGRSLEFRSDRNRRR